MQNARSRVLEFHQLRGCEGWHDVQEELGRLRAKEDPFTDHLLRAMGLLGPRVERLE